MVPSSGKEILIQFKEGVSDEKAREITSELGLAIVSRSKTNLLLYSIRVPDDHSVKSAIQQCRSHPDIAFVAPNLQFTIK